ncbi:hypothetical protein [Thermoflexus hugenholtzii]
MSREIPAEIRHLAQQVETGGGMMWAVYPDPFGRFIDPDDVPRGAAPRCPSARANWSRVRRFAVKMLRESFAHHSLCPLDEAWGAPKLRKFSENSI